VVPPAVAPTTIEPRLYWNCSSKMRTFPGPDARLVALKACT
jgi:hypothetical protein